MEINKHNYQEISKIREGDRIVFNDEYVYSVMPCYLCGRNGKDNEAIFRYINVVYDKLKFCEEAYGYRPRDGFCPEYKHMDFDAALRLIKKIFDKMYPELKKKEEPTFEETEEIFNLLHKTEQKSASKPIKVGSSDQKFTVKVSKIKPKIIS